MKLSMKLSDKHRSVLQSLVDADDYSGFCYISFASISADTQIERKEVRRVCRFLARRGLAQFGKGLWTEDGKPAGSGYCATKTGREVLAMVKR